MLFKIPSPISFASGLLLSYPSSSSLSYIWNMGSLISFAMVTQVITGILLTLFYTSGEVLAFESVDFLSRETFGGISLRVMHLNFASLIFVFLYLHLARGLFYLSFHQLGVWISGSSLFLLTMLSAFLGYVLPWGQMSFWGATVITNLVSTLPYVGKTLVLWIWGGYSVNKATLSLFFTLHFLMPLAILAGIMIHLILLHESSSTSPAFIHESFTKVKFTPGFSSKDFINFCLMLIVSGGFMFTPWSLGDPENWIEANPMQTPVHILPEWYFLFAYAILRAIPNKLGGVVAFALSIGVLFILPFVSFPKSPFTFASAMFTVSMPFVFCMLTYLGASPVESPYLEASQLMTVLYFLMFMTIL